METKRNSYSEQPYNPAPETTPAEGISRNLMYQSSHDNPETFNTPLQTAPAVPPPPIPTALMMKPGGRLAAPQATLVTAPKGQLSYSEGAAVKPQIQPQPSIKQPISIPKQHPKSAFEMEDTTTEAASRGTSWALRLPWFRKKRSRNKDSENSDPSSNQQDTSEDALYYGGLMKSASPSSLSVEATSTVAKMEAGQQWEHVQAAQQHPDTVRVLKQQRQPHRQMPEQAPEKQKRRKSNSKRSKHNEHQLLPKHTPPPPPPPPTYGWVDKKHTTLLPVLTEHSNTNKVFRNRSWISTSSKGSSKRKGRRNASDEDSLADFDETEWTPQDSAYGAAIPVCGWIPKRLRQIIEGTLIVFAVFVLVYLVVTTSIALSEHKSSKNVSYHNDTASGNGVTTYDYSLEVDDDWYIEYRNDGSSSYYDKSGADDDD